MRALLARGAGAGTWTVPTDHGGRNHVGDLVLALLGVLIDRARRIKTLDRNNEQPHGSAAVASWPSSLSSHTVYTQVKSIYREPTVSSGKDAVTKREQ